NHVAHILHDSGQRNVQLLRHVYRFLDDQHCEILRCGNNNRSIDGKRLEYGERSIARTWRKIDQHEMQIAPIDIREQLTYNAVDYWTAPYHWSVRSIEQEVHRYDLDPCATKHWK